MLNYCKNIKSEIILRLPISYKLNKTHAVNCVFICYGTALLLV